MTSAVITAIALLWVALAWTYNRLVAERSQAHQGFADIDVQLKRRAGLVPRLVEVEEHLQYARRFYNGAVQQYVTRVETFPDLVVAKLFRFAPMPFFHSNAREAVRVSL
jgi:hypothetical protein